MTTSAYSGVALKRSAWHFLTGKAASAMLTFIILLWLVRLLPVAEYGAYVTLVAALELSLAISTLGLPWMAARYLPDYRMHASGAALIRYTSRIVILLGGTLVVTAFFILVNLQWLLASVDMLAHADAARLYLLVVVMEGVGRYLRQNALGPLLMQGIAQISLVLRNLILLLLLALMVLVGPVGLRDVVVAELVAASVAGIVALGGLTHRLGQLRGLAGEPGWAEPAWREMWRTARHMYASQLITLAYSPQVFLLMIHRHLGVEAAAVFGFLRTLYEQVSRYLPATLLSSVIRPKLVASFVGSGGVDELTRNANLAGKLSLFVLMPLVVFVGMVPEEMVNLLTGGKFPHTGFYLAGLMLALIPFSQRQILETVAVSTGHSGLCTFAAMLGVFMLPITYFLLVSGMGLWAAILGMGLGHLVFNTAILFGMRRVTSYRPDVPGFVKLMAASVVTYLIVVSIPMAEGAWGGVVGVGIVILAIYLVVAYLIKPFAQSERNRLNRLATRGLFVW